MRQLYIFYCFLITQFVFSQQLPLSSQLFLNKQMINPSFVGQSNQSNFQAGYRTQWVGFNGTPRTILVGGQGVLGNGKYGLGGYLYNDFAGNSITTTGIQIPLACHFQLNDQQQISIGISPIIGQYSMNLLNQTPISTNDPALLNGNINQFYADLNLGISYELNSKLTLGFGTQQMLQSKLSKFNFTQLDSNRLARQFNMFASYLILKTDKISIEPQVFVKSILTTPMQFDFGVKFNLLNQIGFGLYYRSSDALYALFGYDGKKFAVYYSYDYSLSNLRNYSSGSHEVTLIFKLPVKIIPDSDHDGVLDNKDNCKDQAGPKENNGCPWGDKDGDGLNDYDDKCPEIAGPIENKGCPWLDSDGDGVHDGIDNCKDQAGPIENKGCPWGDKDNDGVTDNNDQCPLTKGSIENHGCPVIEEKVKEQITKAVDNLEFENNSDKILSSSYPALDVLILLLKEKSDWSINLAGHTDNVGNDELNMDLSRRRAEAVKNYFISKGIQPIRITTEYFGETKPIDSNDTPQGRKKNRRVEMKLVFN